VIVIHFGLIGSAETLLNFYRQVTDKNFPAAPINPTTAPSNQRIKVIYTTTEAAADLLFTALSWVKTSEDTLLAAFPNILAAGNLFSETSRIGPVAPALRPINNFADFKVGSTYPQF
jgi:hypothetical protein